ncbi:unnamed protein product [Rotaria sp. Silwood2]|nr:unnamed protein product [Rotaria sp. Silwood2]CAF2652592.1 unnamed protein product [Rotaria sp. Silwood2]CAF2725809.1 unnamed protein product [Rotaria sp. Silwood2]CAF2878221.1 unnamed protein product [Rotaria sp. Silwood2]CAF3927843.1 unnamed protein product [Rotaria sp. Silwood2]
MGKKLSKNKGLSASDVQRSSQITQLQPFVIQQVYEAFMDRADKKGRMKINTFKMVYLETNPCADVYNLDMAAERTFCFVLFSCL